MISKISIKKGLFDSPLKILVAEDNAQNQKMLLIVFKKMGYGVDLVKNGLEAVNAYHKKKYDIILMDVRMPQMDGLEATQEIRKICRENSKLAIIAMTGYSLIEDQEKCLKAGMNDYITKPIDMDKLKNVLTKWGKHVKLGKQVKTNQESPTETDLPNEKDAEKNILNTGMIDSIFEIDGGDFITNIFNGFTEEFPQNMQTLKDCIKNEDFENLGFVSHEIKGSSANLGAKSLSEICHTIEMKAKSEDITNLEEDIDALEKMFDSTKIEFDKYISEKRRME